MAVADGGEGRIDSLFYPADPTMKCNLTPVDSIIGLIGDFRKTSQKRPSFLNTPLGTQVNCRFMGRSAFREELNAFFCGTSEKSVGEFGRLVSCGRG